LSRILLAQTDAFVVSDIQRILDASDLLDEDTSGIYLALHKAMALGDL
jgi:hypothetical protein